MLQHLGTLLLSQFLCRIWLGWLWYDRLRFLRGLCLFLVFVFLVVGCLLLFIVVCTTVDRRLYHYHGVFCYNSVWYDWISIFPACLLITTAHAYQHENHYHGHAGCQQYQHQLLDFLQQRLQRTVWAYGWLVTSQVNPRSVVMLLLVFMTLVLGDWQSVVGLACWLDGGFPFLFVLFGRSFPYRRYYGLLFWLWCGPVSAYRQVDR